MQKHLALQKYISPSVSVSAYWGMATIRDKMGHLGCAGRSPFWVHLAKGRIKYANAAESMTNHVVADAIDCASSEAHLAVCKSLIISQ
jgi:hypothetical protein